MQYTVKILSALLTPVIGGVTVWIAYRQWRTSEDANKLNKYEKRYSVYQALKNALLEIGRDSNISSESLSQLTVNTGECVFIFNEEVVSYVKKFREKALRVLKVNRKLCSDMPDKTEPASELKELERWFQAQHQELIYKFTPYLKFRK